MYIPTHTLTHTHSHSIAPTPTCTPTLTLESYSTVLNGTQRYSTVRQAQLKALGHDNSGWDGKLESARAEMMEIAKLLVAGDESVQNEFDK